MPPIQDQYLIIYILSQVANEMFKCPIYPQYNAGVRDKYPFITYNFIDPEHDRNLDETDTMEVTLEIGVQSLDEFQALNMIHRLRRALRFSSGYRRFFTQAHVIPHDAKQMNNQDYYGYQNAIYSYSFDCSFSLYQVGTVYKPEDLNFVFNESTIESIKAMNALTGKSIDVSKEDK